MNLILDVFDSEQMMTEMLEADTAFQNAVKKAKQELREKVRKKVKRELIKYNLDGTNYANSITYDYVDDGVVVNFPDIYLYLEFGTGIMGKGSPHPDPSFSGQFNGYNVGKYSSDPTRFGPVGYWPFPTDDGDYRITGGRASAPVAYETWVFAQKRIVSIFNKHLKEAGF